jgi:DNA repair protein RadC
MKIKDIKIKQLPRIERPREKLIRYGAEGLSTPELFAVLLGTGRRGESVLQMATRVANSLSGTQINAVSYQQMKGLAGIGNVKACTILACLEIGKRLLMNKQSSLILQPKDVWEELRTVRDQKKEHFVVFYLDIRNQIIKKDIISIGTLTASLVHPREVFEPAIREGAAQIIVSHNHPSSVVEPSQEDIELTHRLHKAGQLLGIEVIDHIIVGKTAYFSFKEHKML